MAEDSEPQILIRFMEAMKQAAGCAHQLAHAQQNPAFLLVRDSCEALRQTSMRMAVSKPVPRKEVLAMLDRREGLVN